MDGFVRLIEQKYFAVDRFEVAAGGSATVTMDGPGCLVGLRGAGLVKSGDGAVELTAGRAVVVPKGCGSVVVEAEAGISFVRCVAPV